jgi:hypothetical protein
MADNTVLLALVVSYKIFVLLVGLGMAYMGFRLFMADKIAPAGHLTGGYGKYSLSLKGGAPGVFFSLFGTIIIGISVFRGVVYDDLAVGLRRPPIAQVIPDAPPK